MAGESGRCGVAPWLLFAALGSIGFVLAHDAITGDFLGFLPETIRAGLERAVGVPAPAAGEGSRWRLEYADYLYGGRSDVWLGAVLAILSSVGIVLIYRQEGNAVGTAFRALLIGLRVGLLLLLLVVLLPQLALHFERQGWPDLALVLDDSQSMSAIDSYREDHVRSAADALAAQAELSDEEKADVERAVAKAQSGGPAILTRACRLRLAQTLLTADGEAWLQQLMLKRRVRLHVYRCAARAERLADATTEAEIEKAGKAVAGLSAIASHDSSQLGGAVTASS